MKEEYLHIHGLEKEIDEMLAELSSRNYRPKPWKLHPEKAALLVLDMQNYFLNPSSHAFTPSAPAILTNVRHLILMAERNRMEIIFTKHVNDALNAGMMSRWWKDMIREGSFEAQISETLSIFSPVRDDSMVEKNRESNESPVRDDSMVKSNDPKIIVKHQYDAFYQTDLEEFLHSKKIEQVIISGLLANLCCETTARSAFVRGFEVFFPVDATAAYNRDFHISTFRNLCFGFCPLMKTSELINSVYED